MDVERIVAGLVEKVERRYYGKYRGFVVDNDDPACLGRLKLKVPSVLGNEVVTGWALPCTPYGGAANQGFLFIPERESGVWVEFEEGDLEFPIWVGTFWSKPGGDSELPKNNKPDGSEDGNLQNPQTRKIIKTLKGHTIQFEDKDGEDMITLVEAANGNVITMNKNGITISDGNGNKILMAQSGLTVQDRNGNKIAMDANSGVQSGPGIVVNDGSYRICLAGLIEWLLAHQHLGNMGAPTPLFPADMVQLRTKMDIPQGGILSDTVKAK